MKIFVETGNDSLEELIEIDEENETVKTLYRGHLINEYPIHEVTILY